MRSIRNKKEPNTNIKLKTISDIATLFLSFKLSLYFAALKVANNPQKMIIPANITKKMSRKANPKPSNPLSGFKAIGNASMANIV